MRGGYGNPIKVLRTDQPVADVVATAFTQGLEARGMMAPNATPGTGPLTLAVTVVTFNCDQVVRREARADFTVVVTDRASGRVVYRDDVKTDVITGNVIALDTGIFGSTEDLRRVAMTALSQAVDQALDKPGFPGRPNA